MGNNISIKQFSEVTGFVVQDRNGNQVVDRDDTIFMQSTPGTISEVGYEKAVSVYFDKVNGNCPPPYIPPTPAEREAAYQRIYAEEGATGDTTVGVDRCTQWSDTLRINLTDVVDNYLALFSWEDECTGDTVTALDICGGAALRLRCELADVTNAYVELMKEEDSTGDVISDLQLAVKGSLKSGDSITQTAAVLIRALQETGSTGNAQIRFQQIYGV